MKAEQLSIMKVIEFPKNRQYEVNKRNDKLETAYQLLKYIVDEGADYHIVISRKDADKLFEGELRDFTVITSNLDELKKLELYALRHNFSFYPLQGGEFD